MLAQKAREMIAHRCRPQREQQHAATIVAKDLRAPAQQPPSRTSVIGLVMMTMVLARGAPAADLGVVPAPPPAAGTQGSGGFQRRRNRPAELAPLIHNAELLRLPPGHSPGRTRTLLANVAAA